MRTIRSSDRAALSRGRIGRTRATGQCGDERRIGACCPPNATARLEQSCDELAERRTKGNVARRIEDDSDIAYAAAANRMFDGRGFAVDPARNGVPIQRPHSREPADERSARRRDAPDRVDRRTRLPIAALSLRGPVKENVATVASPRAVRGGRMTARRRERAPLGRRTPASERPATTDRRSPRRSIRRAERARLYSTRAVATTRTRPGQSARILRVASSSSSTVSGETTIELDRIRSRRDLRGDAHGHRQRTSRATRRASTAVESSRRRSRRAQSLSKATSTSPSRKSARTLSRTSWMSATSRDRSATMIRATRPRGGREHRRGDGRSEHEHRGDAHQ